MWCSGCAKLISTSLRSWSASTFSEPEYDWLVCALLFGVRWGRSEDRKKLVYVSLDESLFLAIWFFENHKKIIPKLLFVCDVAYGCTCRQPTRVPRLAEYRLPQQSESSVLSSAFTGHQLSSSAGAVPYCCGESHPAERSWRRCTAAVLTLLSTSYTLVAIKVAPGHGVS